MRMQQSVFGLNSDEKVTLLLTDFRDNGNAGAGPTPRNTVLVDIAPVNLSFETFAPNERMYTLMNHELVHLSSTDTSVREDQRFRRLFRGKVRPQAEHPETILYAYFTNPRMASPRWYHEGIAVFMETWMAGGIGRAQGAYDEMVFRSMVRDGAHFYDPLGLVSEGTEIDFQGGVNAYLYGTRFMSYLAYTYSPESLIAWIARTEGSERYYSSQFKSVFGIPLETAWQDWIEWEHQFQEANLDAIKKFPITPHRDLSERALGSVSRAYLDPDTRKLYAAFFYPGTVAHIGSISIDDGTVDKIKDVKGPMLYRVTSLAYDQTTKTIFYSADNSAYRDLMSINVQTGESSMLLKDARIGSLVFNRVDRSIWGVRHMNGIATIVRIPHPYDEWNQVYSWPYGNVAYDLDISPDGSLLSASIGEINGNQALRVMEIESLLAGDPTPINTFDFGLAVPEGFVFSPDGRYLFGSSYYTGVSNIFRYELDSGDIEAMSNVSGGLFRPIPLDDGTLITFRYTGQGFMPTKIQPEPLEDVSAVTFLGNQVVEKHTIIKNWQVGSPAEIPLNELITNEGDYTPIKNLSLESIYPVIEGYKDSFAFGLHINFSDYLMLDTLDIAATYSPDNELQSSERTHAELNYRHVATSTNPLSGTWSARLAHNDADFYDLFGPTKKGLKGNSVSLGYDKTLIYDKPRQLDLQMDLNHYSDLERLPSYQNVDINFDELTTFEARLNYTHVRSSLGHVDDEKGFKWSIIATVDHVNGETIPKVFGNFDFGFALPWNHSSIWLRNSAGIADGQRDNEFANFYFGGFGNNYIDRGTVKRYREEYSLPGFELNEVAGRSFYRTMLEWNLPPIRFRRLGTPGFYVSSARPAFFATNLITNPDNASFRRNVSDVGAQIDFRFTILSGLDMTLSLGYAVGSGEGANSPDEFMISLKVL